MNFRLQPLVLILCLTFWQGMLLGQACPQLGLNTVEEAENQFFNNRKIETRKLLEKAYSQCRRDGPVIRRIAETYKMIGDTSEYEHYTRVADELGAVPTVRMTVTQTEPQPLPTLVHHKFALVVGVSQFKDFSDENKKLPAGQAVFQQIPNLQYAAKDARDFADTLLSPRAGRFSAERVDVLLDKAVTADRVRRSIARIEQEATEDDLVVLYFSSHGSSPEMDPAAASAKSGFVLMHDTEYQKVLNTATAYPMYELVNSINRFRARRVIAFLDTCYSGDTVGPRGARSLNGAEGSKGLMVGLQEAEEITRAVPQDKARVIITSSGANERSWESDDGAGGNGYFTRYLLEAMKKDSGQDNISQVFRYINETVPAAVAREKSGAPQHPQFRSFPDPKFDINILIGAPETEGSDKQ